MALSPITVTEIMLDHHMVTEMPLSYPGFLTSGQLCGRFRNSDFLACRVLEQQYGWVSFSASISARSMSYRQLTISRIAS